MNRTGAREDWTTINLETACSRLTSGGTPKSGDPRYYIRNGIPFAKIEDLTESQGMEVRSTALTISKTAVEETSVKVFPEGTIFITMYGTLGVVRVAGMRMATNQAIAALVPPFNCEPRFLLHALGFSQDELVQLAGQTTQANLSLTKLKSFELEIPSDRVEQRRIADVLDTVDAAIQETDSVIEKQEQVKTGLLQDLLTRGLDADGRLRDPEREAFQTTEMGRLPLDWSVRPLDELAEIGSGVAINRSRTKTNPVELPYLRVANVQDGYLDLSEIKTVEIASSKVKRYLLKPGDVLMTEGGDYDKLGRGTVWRGQIQPCAHQNHIFRVRANQDELNPYYLSAVTGSDYGKQYFLRNSKQTTNLATINKTQLRNFPVPCPPVEEQDRILERLFAQEEQIEEEREYGEKLKYLKTGLMQDLLTGRVRVPEAEVRVDEVVA